MKYLSVLFVFVLFFNCKNETNKTELTIGNADEIINKSIAVSGGNVLVSNATTINFDFRSIAYEAEYKSSHKLLSRLMLKDNDTVRDVLNGQKFQRFINEKPVVVSDTMIPKYSASVNSVHYFSVLPNGLNDKAVNKELIGEESVKEKDYYKIRVTFSQNGGGEDYEDVFIYWVNKETFKPDYLAYSYDEDDGKGIRFREAYNERYVNELRFVDYNNYKAEDKSIQLSELAKAFDNNTLTLLSKIELENVEVSLN